MRAVALQATRCEAPGTGENRGLWWWTSGIWGARLRRREYITPFLIAGSKSAPSDAEVGFKL
jgi:hypothetical protein